MDRANAWMNAKSARTSGPTIATDNVTQRENDVGPDAVFPGAGKRFGVAEG